eukprot:7746512-Pyramimonas_sp.AAC.1
MAGVRGTGLDCTNEGNKKGQAPFARLLARRAQRQRNGGTTWDPIQSQRSRMTGSAPAPATNPLQSAASSGSESGTSAQAALCPDSCFPKPSPVQGGDEVGPGTEIGT